MLTINTNAKVPGKRLSDTDIMQAMSLMAATASIGCSGSHCSGSSVFPARTHSVGEF